MFSVEPGKARKLIEKGHAPADMRVSGRLDLSGTAVKELPWGLHVDVLDVSGCSELRELPPELKVRRLVANDCSRLKRLPARFSCYELEMRRTGIEELPADLRVEYRLNLEGSRALTSLPEGLKVGVLILRDCKELTALPEGLDVLFLDLSGCENLAVWPRSAGVRIGCVNARNCFSLKTLPEGLEKLAWIDLAGTSVTSLPPSLEDVRLRWRGVQVDRRIVFEPETIRAGEVLEEENVERRRVLLERMGYERFLAEAKAKVLDQDTDPGGVRQLLRVPMRDDEPLVCVSVRCPSTARQYVLRVPPTTRTCRQAAAWIAGFDNEKAYRPIVET